MAISDKYLLGNLNTAESEMLNQTKLSDESIRSRLEQQALQNLMESGDSEFKEMIGSLLSAGTPIGEILRIIQSRMDSMTTLSPGNLNRTELDQLQGSEPGTGMSSEFRELIDRLIAMGVPKAEVLKIIQSRMDAMTADPLMSTAEGQFGGSPHGEGPFWNQYNQGGIVSLRRLTRPLGY